MVRAPGLYPISSGFESLYVYQFGGVYGKRKSLS